MSKENSWGALQWALIWTLSSFFQAFLRQVARVGGTNLLKPIGTTLGVNLGKHAYRGILDWKEALLMMSKCIGGDLEGMEVGGDRAIELRCRGEFCPIGRGEARAHFKPATERTCKPHLTRFLIEFKVNLGRPFEVQWCIVRDGGTTWQFRASYAP